MSNKLLREIFKVEPKFHCFYDKVATARERYGDIRTFFTRFPNPVGIEIEVEGFNTGHMIAFEKLDPLFWTLVNDGSLKNKGKEFVSIPIGGQCIDYAIHEFEQVAKAQPFSWSVRTSVHVHVNVSEFSVEQLTHFTALYAIFENLFFALADPERKGNPYCYPLTSITPASAHEIQSDSKYCAFNSAPIRSQLTVEFRHLQGTDDCRLIRRWVQLIQKLHRYVEENTKDNWRDLLTSYFGRYSDLAKLVFGKSIILFENKGIHSLCEQTSDWAAVYMAGQA
jgi:hypothetical protein